MKIGVVGNYGNNNNGDEAILMGIVQQLEENFPINRQDILVFSNNPEQTEERYGVKADYLFHKRGSAAKTLLETVKQGYKRMKDLDILVIGGGGILMDLYKREAPLFSTYGLMAHYAGCKVIVYGVGAGPIKYERSKFFLRQLAKKVQSISVRDPESRNLLKQIGIKKEIDIIGDPAFSLKPDRYREKTDRIRKIGVTAVPYFNLKYWPSGDDEKYHAYVNGMAANLDKLIEEDPGLEVTFYSTKYPQDVWVTQEIFKQMKRQDHVQVIEDNLSPVELLKVSADQDVIIGTRLHSMILALDVHTPVIGIGYHHKVMHFMKLIEKEEYAIQIERLDQNSQLFSSRIRKMNDEWGKTQTDYETIAQQMHEQALLGRKQFEMLKK